MTRNRRSLSASLGSWRVQLAYDPVSRRERETAPSAREPLAPGVARALLPAFVASGASVGAACWALAHFLNLAQAPRLLAIVLSVALVISYGARCAPAPWSRLCVAARWPLAVVLAICAASLGWNPSFGAVASDDPNLQAATFIGFVILLSVLLIGARSGGRIVPVAAPLVPGLSLFGLLYLAAVDTTTQLCFLLWAGAALYLLCYDRFLRRVAPELSSGLPQITAQRTVLTRQTPAWAIQSALVSGVWLALFLGAGALLYWPVQQVLPNLATFSWSRGNPTVGERKLDYRGNARVMELRGGSHALSERPMLRVTVNQGTPSGLWRGRVYEFYSQSQWSEREALRSLPTGETEERAHPFQLARPQTLDPLQPIEPRLSAREGTVDSILELVEPLNNTNALVYASGQPLSLHLRPDQSDFSGAASVEDDGRPSTPYLVRSFVTRPNLKLLTQAPGFDPKNSAPSALKENLLLNLRLPQEPSTRQSLKGIAAQVRGGGLPVGTPEEKIRAIAAYLKNNCVYSLQAPEVPPTQDATLFFLSDSREGACDMFASSMALLAREMGVPTRVITGYLDAGTENSQINAQGRTIYTLRERDAHAWVEYYVPHYGWLAFDPTQNTREAPTSWLGQLARMFKFSGLPLPPGLLVLPLLGAALLAAGLWQRRAAKPARPQENGRQRIEAIYAQSVRLLSTRVPYAPTLTPGEYEARVGRARLTDAAKQEFAALTHLYLAARYGPVPPAKAAQVEACLARLKKALRDE